MKQLRPVYRDIKDWEIINTQTVYDFSTPPRAIHAIEVLIGTLYMEEVDLHQHYNETTTPITRWITEEEYQYLKQNEGTIIW